MDTLITDTLRIIVEQSNEPIKFVLDNTYNPWEFWFLLVAIISLIFVVGVPFTQKKYEESKAKNSFNSFVKYKLNNIYSGFMGEKTEYYTATKNEALIKSKLEFDKYFVLFWPEYEASKKVINRYSMAQSIINFQNILLGIHKINYLIKITDIDSITEKTLAFGEKLTKNELNSIYSVIASVSAFGTVTTFDDRFADISFVKRRYAGKFWIGNDVDLEALKNLSSEEIKKDFSILLENEERMKDILIMCEITLTQIQYFFGHLKGKTTNRIPSKVNQIETEFFKKDIRTDFS